MKRSLLLRQGLACIALLFCLSTQGQSGTQPKFSVIPVQRAPAQLPANSIGTAQYAISNNTNISRTLTMVPIPGISQNISGANSCSSPFVLAPGGFCLLNLVINAAMLGPHGVHQGPMICKTKSPFDHSPDPFLCSQADYPDSLDITVVPAVPIGISPNPLSFTAGGRGSLTIQNNSAIPIYNINATILPGSPIGISTSSCPSILLPGAACTLMVTSALPGSTIISIQAGSNEILATVPVTASPASMSLSPNPLSFTVGGTGTLTIQNTSTVPINNLTATLPTGSVITLSGSSCGVSLAPGNSCTLSLSAVVAGSTALSVQASNTSRVLIPVTAILASISVSPSSLSFTAGDTGTLTVQNTSAGPVNNLTATVPVGSVITLSGSTCGASLAPGSTCTLSFGAATKGSTTVSVQGSNTVTVAIPVTATLANISVSPSVLLFAVNDTSDQVTVTNDSAVVANNVAPIIPNGSTLTYTSDCPGSLPPGGSCHLSFSAPTAQFRFIAVKGSNTTSAFLLVNVQRVPIAIIDPPPPTALSLFQNGSGIVTIKNNAMFNLIAHNIHPQFPPSSGLSVSNNNCLPDLAPGATCTMQLNALRENATVAIVGSNTTMASLSVSVTGAVLDVSPTSLTLTADGVDSQSVTVTNNSSSDVTNITVTIPPGSSIIDVNNCPNPLPSIPPNNTCTISFTASAAEAQTVVTIQGDNTNSTPVSITALGQPILTVSNTHLVIPVNGGPVNVTVINNNASPQTATNVTAIIPSSLTGLEAYPEPDCSNLAAGASCVISFSSTMPYAALAAIEISGSNTIDNPTVALAFTQGGGYIFEVSPQVLVADMTDLGAFNYLTAIDACPFYASGGYTGWFLPNITQLVEMHQVLFHLGFGNFAQGSSPPTTLYWSSTNASSNPQFYAMALAFETGPAVPVPTPKDLGLRTRCIRDAS